MQGKFLTVCFALLIGLFCLLLVNLFLLRFQAGDIYPPYSSLRSDPLGAKALAAALERLGSVTVERNFSPAERLEAPGDTSLLFLGIKSGKTRFIPEKEYEQLENLLDSGCRMVVALTPADLDSFDRDSPDPPGESAAAPETGGPQASDLYAKWGIELRYHKAGDGHSRAIPDPGNPYLFRSVPWPLALWFAHDETEWKTLYKADGKPVILEREFGRGRVVLLADSYIFSNESLKKDNNSRLLAWLCRGRPRVVFDEFHFGVRITPGISTLARKYKLYGPLAFFAVLAGLMIWKRASGLVPPDEGRELAALADEAPRDNLSTMSGLTSLLKQHIPRSGLINECKAAWKEAFVKDNKASAAHRALFEKIGAPEKKLNPADDYIRICRILSKGKNQ
ncbi:MAG: DUF4350 domain-containing protein [Desulfobacterales bacterium]|nr:DUF4350 domain-containing protein [Desulfobacterales bacterium]